MEIKLTVYDNSNRSLAKRIALPCVIGRSRVSSFPVPDPLVSRRHCEIFADNKGVMLKDLDSLNGTFLGGRRIVTVMPLKIGDFFTIGDYRFCISEVTEEDRRNLELSEPKKAAAYDPHQSVPTVSSLDSQLGSPLGGNALGNDNRVNPFGNMSPNYSQSPFGGLQTDNRQGVDVDELQLIDDDELQIVDDEL